MTVERAPIGRVFARRLKEARNRRGWSQRELAEHVTAAGYPLSRVVVTKIEEGGERAENASIGELLALAVVLGVAPVHLLDPHEDDYPDETEFPATPERAVPSATGQAWLRGAELLPDGDFGAFFAAMPKRQQEAVLRGHLEAGLPSIERALLAEQTSERVEELRRQLLPTEQREED
jgi:transcriptional regulator with XRE-family HTH domain